MRDREIWLLPQHGRCHLQNPHYEPCELGQSVFAVMMADALVLHMKQVCQFANLEAVAGGQNHGVAAFLQLLDDGLEERNVRRVLQIDPYLFARHLLKDLQRGFGKGTHGRVGRGWGGCRRVGTTLTGKWL